jgi:hypothetical protein
MACRIPSGEGESGLAPGRRGDPGRPGVGRKRCEGRQFRRTRDSMRSGEVSSMAATDSILPGHTRPAAGREAEMTGIAAALALPALQGRRKTPCASAPVSGEPAACRDGGFGVFQRLTRNQRLVISGPPAMGSSRAGPAAARSNSCSPVPNRTGATWTMISESRQSAVPDRSSLPLRKGQTAAMSLWRACGRRRPVRGRDGPARRGHLSARSPLR